MFRWQNYVLSLALWTLLALASPQLWSQPVTNPAPVGIAGAYNSSSPTCTNSQFCFLQADSAGNLKATTTDVLGNSITVKPASTASVSTDTSLVVQLNPISPGLITTGTQNAPSATTLSVNSLPSSAITAGLSTAQTTALASNLVAKAGAGNLYGLQLGQSAAANFVMLFDATSAPGDGSVTPKKCIPLLLTDTRFTINFPTPIYFATGITVVLSSAGCYTKTATNAAFIGVDYQ